MVVLPLLTKGQCSLDSSEAFRVRQEKLRFYNTQTSTGQPKSTDSVRFIIFLRFIAFNLMMIPYNIVKFLKTKYRKVE